MFLCLNTTNGALDWSNSSSYRRKYYDWFKTNRLGEGSHNTQKLGFGHPNKTWDSFKCIGCKRTLPIDLSATDHIVPKVFFKKQSVQLLNDMKSLQNWENRLKQQQQQQQRHPLSGSVVQHRIQRHYQKDPKGTIPVLNQNQGKFENSIFQGNRYAGSKIKSCGLIDICWSNQLPSAFKRCIYLMQDIKFKLLNTNTNTNTNPFSNIGKHLNGYKFVSMSGSVSSTTMWIANETDKAFYGYDVGDVLLNDLDNTQLLCVSCNTQKGNKALFFRVNGIGLNTPGNNQIGTSQVLNN